MFASICRMYGSLLMKLKTDFEPAINALYDGTSISG